MSTQFVSAGTKNVTPTILVVDDEPDIRFAVKGVLEATLGANVLVAASGEQALAILAKKGVDLIMTDFKMPGMNGVEFLQRAKLIAPNARVIVITAFERELIEAMSGVEEADTVILKPLSPRPLVQTVERILARR